MSDASSNLRKVNSKIEYDRSKPQNESVDAALDRDTTAPVRREDRMDKAVKQRQDPTGHMSNDPDSTKSQDLSDNNDVDHSPDQASLSQSPLPDTVLPEQAAEISKNLPEAGPEELDTAAGQLVRNTSDPQS